MKNFANIVNLKNSFHVFKIKSNLHDTIVKYMSFHTFCVLNVTSYDILKIKISSTIDEASLDKIKQ